MIRASILALALFACTSETSPRGGTAVGNPGEIASSMARAAGAQHASASVDRASLQWVGCDGSTATTAIDGALDLLVPVPQTAPSGTWCAVELVHDAPVVVLGDGDAGGTYDLQLDVPVVHIDFPPGEGFEVDGDVLLLEVGKPGWLDAVALGVTDGNDLRVRPADAEHEALARALANGSAIFVDDDEDGEVDDDERGSGSLGEGPEYDDDDDDDDDDD